MRNTRIDYVVTSEDGVLHKFSLKLKGDNVPKSFGDKTRIVRSIRCSCGGHHMLHSNIHNESLFQQKILVGEMNNYTSSVNLGTGEIVREQMPGC